MFDKLRLFGIFSLCFIYSIGVLPSEAQSVNLLRAKCIWKGNNGENAEQECNVSSSRSNDIGARYKISWEDGYITDVARKKGGETFSTPEGKIAQVSNIYVYKGVDYPRKIHLVGLGSVFINYDCDLRDSVYRDVNTQSFVLEFDAPSQNLAVTIASATIKHKSRGRIFSFDVGQSNGYGSYWVGSNTRENDSHGLYFFSSDLKRFSGFRESASPYLFIEGLGSSDYYLNDERGDKSIGDTMWKLDYCKN